MAYTKTTWLDRVVQFPMRFFKTGETSGGVTLSADSGTVTQAGTPINAANLNKLEQGVQDAHTTADAALPKAGGTMTGALSWSNGTKISDSSTASLFWASNDYFEVITENGVSSIFRADNALSLARFKGRDIWDTSILRTTNGYVEWNNGGTWIPMGDIQVGRQRLVNGVANTPVNTWTTVVNVTGVSGRLESAFINVGAGNIGQIRVTIDGMAETVVQDNSGGGSTFPVYYLQDTTGGSGSPTTEPIYFYSSLKVEIQGNNLGSNFGFCTYRLKAGTA